MRRAQDVGALGHEVHAAEDDELGLGLAGAICGEPERVAGVVGELDHLVALVVMAEDDQTRAERCLRRGDAASISSSDRPRYRSGSGWRSPSEAFSTSVSTGEMSHRRLQLVSHAR